MNQLDYLKVLERWVPYSRQYLFSLPGHADTLFFGESSSASWAVQTSCNAFAAYSVLAADPAMSEKTAGISREDLLNAAQSLLRGILYGHAAGQSCMPDGRKWGLSWISPLALERMMHGVEAIMEHLDADVLYALRSLLTAECDWHTDQNVIRAGLYPPDNRPESNIWSGCMLYRTVDLFPDVPRAEEYMDKGLEYLINGISVPADLESNEKVCGKAVKDISIGANFGENYSLDHHAYLNVGYMVICLSNLAMYHFSRKKSGQQTPSEILRHITGLWNVVKKFTFENGRLLRIGGDTRARYCYCQDYCIPAWLFLLDVCGDRDIPQLERGWLELVKNEQNMNDNGSFLSNRLASFKENSFFYYIRLEGDRAGTLSMGAYWRRIFNIQSGQNDVADKFTGCWSNSYHGAVMERSESRVAAWCWHGGQGPLGIYLPAGKSDMAEWQTNLCGEVYGQGRDNIFKPNTHYLKNFSGGFVSSGSFSSVNMLPMGEGEDDNAPIAEHYIAFAVLPDETSAICIQSATMRSCRYTSKIKGIGWKIPNDIHNGQGRKYTTINGTFELRRGPLPEKEVIDLKSPWLMVDDSISIHLIYGDSLKINRPEERNIQVLHKSPLKSLYCDEVCGMLEDDAALHVPGEILYDQGFLLKLGNNAQMYHDTNPPGQITLDNEFCRGVIAKGGNGKTYVLIANFDQQKQQVTFEISGCSAITGVSGQTPVKTENSIFSIALSPCQTILFEAVSE